ncbi:unnamed protein product, partial [Mesorhabditis belari]|uniref:Uncharacterized protein n=1 Tax=Mesorhabditis belari TaxID=2138241 RepID=A0AAF3JBD3_9BILA
MLLRALFITFVFLALIDFTEAWGRGGGMMRMMRMPMRLGMRMMRGGRMGMYGRGMYGGGMSPYGGMGYNPYGYGGMYGGGMNPMWGR